MIKIEIVITKKKLLLKFKTYFINAIFKIFKLLTRISYKYLTISSFFMNYPVKDNENYTVSYSIHYTDFLLVRFYSFLRIKEN